MTCPSWCTNHPLRVDDRENHHRSDLHVFMTPDFWSIRVYLVQVLPEKPVLRVGSLGLLASGDSYPYDQPGDVADLMSKLGREDIAQAIEQLAAQVQNDDHRDA